MMIVVQRWWQQTHGSHALGIIDLHGTCLSLFYIS